jgi:peptide/nickel transport system permease protein
MFRFILRRILATIAVLFGVSILIFSIVQLTPGDAARAQLPSNAPEEQVQQLRDAMGLDQPLPVQYAYWLRDALQGDFGRSYQHRISAFGIVKERFPNTVILATSALVVSVIVGLAIGIIAGTRPNTAIDRGSTIFGIVGASLPSFWLAIMLLIIFSLKVRWFPAVGMYDVRDGGGLLDLAHHLVLPTIATAAVPAAVIARQVRSSILEIMSLDYIRTARAKGLLERVVVVRHALRNALPGFITIVALQAGYLLGGSLITEVVFSWPGMGQQLYTSIGARDIPVIMTITVLIAVVFTSLNLLADIFQGVVDPRVRLS